jgi:hypothetical protein
MQIDQTPGVQVLAKYPVARRPPEKNVGNALCTTPGGPISIIAPEYRR